MNIQDLIKPLTPLLCSNLDKQVLRVGNRKASLIIFDGGVGSGKTHSGVSVADYLNRDLINLKYQYGMGGTDFEKKLRVCVDQKKKVIIYDEAGDFSRRGAITGFNKRLNRIFETYRTFEIIVILILPCVDILDSQMFTNKIPRILLNCHNKVQGKYTRFRAYSLYRMFWLKKNFKDLTVKPQAYTKVRPNFRGLIRPLSEERAYQVDNLSTAGKLTELNNGLKVYTKHDIAKKLNKNPAYVSQRLRAKGIKPAKKIKTTNYYPEQALDIFE